ncbi:putative UPF0481 protein At3g02645 [Dioscorea cayenensis subsp. rotundata]|uniref:UPF0481 protein At3g02645 n=1 Tax=Dioscorea cayennensis subsp. rotundata TaxID=55577 RepID=A0AB40BMD6_DIOCR|nr:putative UPF0481 protein At3g02645 [Dioscorea cayenensis subsp. rotundata]
MAEVGAPDKIEEVEVDDVRKSKPAPYTKYVIPSIREVDGGSYDPKVISIGPYHSKKTQLLPMEDTTRASEPQVRKMYSEKFGLESDDLAETLVLDGCFILELFIKLALKEENEVIFDEMWKLPLIFNDLLLLENQIPFFILQELFDCTIIPGISTKDKNEPPLITLPNLALICTTTSLSMSTLQMFPDDVEIHHLLHLFHMNLTPSPKQKGSRFFPVDNIPTATELQEAGIIYIQGKEKIQCAS